MRTRQPLFGHHRIVDGVLFICIIVLSHLAINCQCQRPFTNISQSSSGATVSKQQQQILYDSNVARSAGGGGTGRSGSGGASGRNRGRTGIDAGVSIAGQMSPPPQPGFGQTSIDYGGDGEGSDRNRGHFDIDEGSADGSPIQLGRNPANAGYGQNSPTFDIKYRAQSSAVDPQQPLQPNRDRKHTFLELRKNLNEHRKQWDRQGDDPEQNNYVKLIKSKINKSDVSMIL